MCISNHLFIEDKFCVTPLQWFDASIFCFMLAVKFERSVARAVQSFFIFSPIITQATITLITMVIGGIKVMSVYWKPSNVCRNNV